MTTNSTKLVILLMVGAALAASPALAQAVTGGNKGPADIPATRDAPLSLPGPVNPSPTPKVDASTTRDIFALDPEQALASLGTASIDRDGNETETPPSDTLRAIFDAMKGSKGN